MRTGERSDPQTPSGRRLALTTMAALAAAALIVVAFVLPAEYGVDPWAPAPVSVS
jgi:hypothetical protein